MHPRSRLAPAVLLALAALLSCSAPALASGSSAVIVRVEGETHTLVGPVEVQTPESPVSAGTSPEHTCAGDSGLGALAVATGGNWGGEWFGGFGYAIDSVLGESHAFGSGSFWNVWFQHSEATVGLCEILEPASGSEVLLFPCPESVLECSPLALSAPAVANVGEAVTAHVVSYTKSGSSAPVAGASVTGGAAPATTDSNGNATVTFGSAGEITLSVGAPNAVRDEAQVCVHNGADGTCGTTPGGPGSGPGGGPAKGGTGPGTQVLSFGPSAIVTKVSSVRNGARYSRRRAPRVLAGTISAHTAVISVSLELRRSYRGHCSFYDAARGRFVGARCGKGHSFPVSSAASFSYLLPKRLGPGRYVLDVSALDAAGDRTTPALGSSRLVFRVR
jgi:hypothetical protein